MTRAEYRGFPDASVLPLSSSKKTPAERWSWLTTTRSVPLMMNVPLSVMSGSSPRYTSWPRCSRIVRVFASLSWSKTTRRSVTFSGIAKVMPRSWHSYRVLRIAEVERVELQQRVVVVVGDREHRLEDSLEPDVLPAVRGGILLQKRLVRALLHLNEVRNLNDRRDLAEVLTAAAPALDHSCHMFSRRTVTSSSTRPAPRLAPQGGSPPLLDLDARSLLLELLLHLLRLDLSDLLLHRLRRTVDEVLRFLEPERGQLAHDLDDLDLLLARSSEDDIELRLLLGRGAGPCRRPRGARHGGHRHRRGRRHAPLLLEQLGELRGLEQCQLVELFGDLLNRGHRIS